MALFKKGSELDRWATALGATNDDAAMKALARVMAQLRAVQALAADVAKSTTDAPDSEVSEGAGVAVAEIDTAQVELVAVYRKFQRHQRGR